MLRAEYPRPQFVRDAWLNLNGPWSYVFDFGKSGREHGFAESEGFADMPDGGMITVPFCPESKLSGVAHTDFIEMMWYQRQITVPADWAGQRVILHFGAVDYECEAFIDGVPVGRHWGGTVAFSFDITHAVTPGKTHNLVLYVRDEVRSRVQPAGKQSPRLRSYGCMYTRTTGIWQTVWLEPVPEYGLKQVQIIPDLDNASFVVVPTFYAERQGLRFRATVLGDGEVVDRRTLVAGSGLPYVLPLSDVRPWSPEDPFLYDLVFEVLDGDIVVDTVRSYAGLRKVHIEGNRVFLNNAPRYLRLVLDQGFYPDGLWTAPSDEALKRDIELSLAAGFNGARLHQKVFEPRFHYWADRLGYLTWGESSSWGIDVTGAESARNFLTEWREIVTRDRNHPSIIAWTPFNETRGGGGHPQHARHHADAYDLTHVLDPTRPVNDASGYVHVKTDLWTVHNYTQDPESLKAQLAIDPEQGVWRNAPDVEVAYQGQPYIVDEVGGIKWIPREDLVFAADSWGYGEDPTSLEAFYARLEGLMDAVLMYDHICGYCYTQLTDIEQEQNGVYNYDRTEKFDMARIAAVFRKEGDRG
ncbi:MAG: beta-glucuronidase [Anaerolineae bacterium]|nr:beta-glucuronidase [Anaerolineae bacterium]